MSPAYTKPHIVLLGGANRVGSVTERAVRFTAELVESLGASCEVFAGPELDLPMYNPDHEGEPPAAASTLIEVCHGANGMLWSSPMYQGTVASPPASQTTARRSAPGRSSVAGACRFGFSAFSSVTSASRSVLSANERLVEESREGRDLTEHGDERGVELWTARKRCLELAPGEELAVLQVLGRPMILAGLGMLFFPAAFAILVVYIRHARRREDPILDLRLLRIRTFRIGTVTGSLCRMGLDATPFLLPLFFQVGFGLSPLHSGLLTFSSSLGAMLVRTVSRAFLRTFGFRRLLAGNALLAAVVTAACGLLRPETPVWVLNRPKPPPRPLTLANLARERRTSLRPQSGRSHAPRSSTGEMGNEPSGHRPAARGAEAGGAGPRRWRGGRSW